MGGVFRRFELSFRQIVDTIRLFDRHLGALLNQQGFRITLGLLCLVVHSGAMAIGLGELHGQPALGNRLELSISILGQEKESLDPSCFRLVRPGGGDDLPWLKQADLRVVAGKPPQLKITSHQVQRDPVVRLAVHLACGHEVYREYTILASPDVDARQEGAAKVAAIADAKQPAPVRRAVKPSANMPASRQVARSDVSAPLAANPRERAPLGGDQLLVSAADIGGDLPLRVSPLLREQSREASDTQREMLRLEFRMLQALHEQAGGQLEMAEKLRAMESALAELQGRALSLTESASENKSAVPPVSNQVPTPRKAVEEDSGWWFYGLLLGVVLALGAWLFLRGRQGRRAQEEVFPSAASEQLIDAPRKGELDDVKRKVDLPLEAPVSGSSQKVDVELAGATGAAPVVAERPQPRALPGDSVLSINATTLDEHFEANPVMELADIMLSFGRVKGAAQALQEYIDNNPQEALQPWIRLMDVYRMAGMREEFEAVSRNLNQHFNVEVQSWSDGKEATEVDLMLDGDGAAAASEAPVRPQALEEMPRIIGSVVKMWDREDVVGYLYELLRDNRGGQRQGFSLPVVEDILFLIELKETANRMEKEGARGL